MSTRAKIFPAWVCLSLVANGLFALAIAVLLWHRHLGTTFEASASVTPIRGVDLAPELGPRHQLNYDQWVALLEQEAEVAADKKPQRLTILVGDSLALWFPVDLLPPDRNWLNQGISGETSSGLLERLHLFEQTQPETILVMIGINDLLRGVVEDALLENQRYIIQYLKQTHPQAQIVVQSILPHSAEGATWEGRDRLLNIPNSQIRSLNRQLAAIADEAGVYYLDLHPLFVDDQGNLRLDLTTDGLHLNAQGYWVWRSALQLFSQLELQSQIP